MAKKNIEGFQFPFGISSPNKMYNTDAYAGPYDTLEDALDTIVEGIRIPGRKFGVYADENKKKVIEYVFELNENNEWVSIQNKTEFTNADTISPTLILESPNGSKFKLKIDDDGSLITEYIN